MKRCGLYVRVSTDNQAKDPEGSLKNQAQRLREEIKIHSSLQEPWTEIKLYVDGGFSGKTINRPQFRELLFDVKEGRINTVLCTELSRISRTVMDFLKILEYFKRYKTELIIIKQKIDTTTAFGKALFTILVALAEFEREMTAHRTSENLLARAKRGLWNGGHLFGYDIDPHNKGHLVVNKKEARIVRLIFDKYIELKSCTGVASYFNRRGYRTKEYTSVRGNHHCAAKFAKQYLHQLLKNYSYIGKKEVNKKYKLENQTAIPESKRYLAVKAVWKGIVLPDKFNRVQALLKRKYRRSPRQLNSHPFLLSGLLKCGVCGCFLEGASSTKESGKKYFYYRHPSKRKTKECVIKPFPCKLIEDAIMSRIKLLMEDNNLIEDAVKLANAKLRKESPKLKALVRDKKKERHSLMVKRDTIIKKMGSLPQDQIQRIISPMLEDFYHREVEVDQEIRQLQAELRALEGNYIEAGGFKKRVTSISELFKGLDADGKKDLMSAFIDDIIIQEGHVRLQFFGTSASIPRDALKFFFEKLESRHYCGANKKSRPFLGGFFIVFLLDENLIPKG